MKDVTLMDGRRITGAKVVQLRKPNPGKTDARVLCDPSKPARTHPAGLGHARRDRRQHGRDHELGRLARHRYARHLDGAALRRTPPRRSDRHARPADCRARNTGLRTDRWRRRSRPRQCAARHGARHRQGEDHRHRRCRRAQLGAFRRLRLLRPDGGRGRADRHGHDLGERYSGLPHIRRPGPPRH